MPIVSRFFGITIRIRYDDHNPPHFHAEYGSDEIVIAISPIAILKGHTSSRARSMVLEWAALHQQELLDDWRRCSTGEVPVPIAPLD